MNTETLHTKTDKQLVPQLRFTEFDGEWTLKRVDEVLSIFNGYAFSSNDAKISGLRWIKIADVGINKMRNDNPSFLPSSYAEKHSKFLLNEGDYVIALTRPILNGELKIAKITKEYSGSLLNQRVGKLVTKEDLEFVYYLLQKNNLISRIDNRIAGTDPPNLSPSEIASLKISISDRQEQQKIAGFLTAVDTKIQQLTQKKELLEQYKKGVMQQLFSQQLRFKQSNGSDYPDWEEKKLGDIGKVKMCKRIFSNQTSESGDIPFFKIGTFGKEADAYITKELYLEFKNKYSFPKIGDILLSASGTLGRTVVYDGVDAYFQDSNIVWLDNNEELVTNAFLFYIYQVVRYDSEGGTIQRLYNSIIASAKFSRPTLPEQQKIVRYLSALDTKTESVAQQITQTQQFKKGLLQRMFV